MRPGQETGQAWLRPGQLLVITTLIIDEKMFLALHSTNHESKVKNGEKISLRKKIAFLSKIKRENCFFGLKRPLRTKGKKGGEKRKLNWWNF